MNAIHENILKARNGHYVHALEVHYVTDLQAVVDAVIETGIDYTEAEYIEFFKSMEIYYLGSNDVTEKLVYDFSFTDYIKNIYLTHHHINLFKGKIMEIKVLYGKTYAALYCLSTETAFGPLFSPLDNVESFLEWLEAEKDEYEVIGISNLMLTAYKAEWEQLGRPCEECGVREVVGGSLCDECYTEYLEKLDLEYEEPPESLSDYTEGRRND